LRRRARIAALLRARLTRARACSVRAALGLKPLKGGGAARAAAPAVDHSGAAAAAAAAAAALAHRVAAQRASRQAEASLRSERALGDADPSVDDAWAWTQRSRSLAARTAAAFDAQEASAACDEDAYTSADLAGMRVHAASADLAEGESMILTLKDARILNAGEEEEEDALENVRLAELRQREAARKAASKKGPTGAAAAAAAFADDGDFLIGGDGKRMLAKYDDAGPAQAITLDAGGTAVDHAKTQRADAMRAKLAAAACGVRASLESTDVHVGSTYVRAQSDYLSAEEIAAQNAPKKMRKKAKKPRGHVRSVTADELVPLEEGGGSGADHGSRAQRAGGAPGGAGGAGGGGATGDVAWSRFEAAKAKATSESAARVGTRVAPVLLASEAPDLPDDQDEADQELARALARSRRAAAVGPNQGTSLLAAAVAQRRIADTSMPASTSGAWMAETAEFVRTISVERAAARAQDAGLTGITGLADTTPESAAAAMPPPMPAPRRAYRARADAAEAAEAEADAPAGSDAAEWAAIAAEAQANARPDAPPLSVDVLGGGGAGGSAARGLAATLSMLKEKGALNEAVKWAGRTTDKKASAVAGAVEAAGITSGDESWQFGFKLDRFDEFGRKMTPKEAFRELCHKFHGIFPSRGKQEARLKQWHEEQASLKVSEGDTPLSAADSLRAATQRTATPFVVLSGSVRSSQVTDASSRYATVEREAGWGTAHGSGLDKAPVHRLPLLQEGPPPPPLEGAEKVRFLLSHQGAGATKRAAQHAQPRAAKRARTATEDATQ